MYKRYFKSTAALSIIFSLLSALPAQAQIINLINNPDAGNVAFATPVVFNNKTYFQYTNQAGNNQLALRNGGNLLLIPNPDNGGGYAGWPIEYNGKLYIQYYNGDSKLQLAEFDGTSLTLIPSPFADESYQYQGSPIIYNGTLYLRYQAPSGKYQLASFSNGPINLIANPDASVGYQGNPIVFNNKLYLQYFIDANTTYQLAQYDGTALTLVNGPAISDGIGYGGSPFIYNGKLYVVYSVQFAKAQLGVYDGVGLTVIPNLPGTSFYVTNPIIYKNKLFFSYYENGDNKLAWLNGNTITTVNNLSGCHYAGNPIIYKDNLYAQSETPSGNQLVKYDSISASMQLIANPANADNYLSTAIVAGDKLFGLFVNIGFVAQLSQFDGTAITLLPNPDATTTGYNGYPFVHNDTLFINYTNQDNITQAGWVGGLSVLPVKLTSFTAKLANKKTTLVQWQTSSETNTSYFNIQRSNDGKNFITVGTLKASGNSATTLNYTYTDNLPATSSNTLVLYYRLQSISNTGAGTYSNIAPVRLANNSLAINIYPNPVKDIIHVYSVTANNNASISLLNTQGKVLYNTVKNLTAGGHLPIPAAGLVSGTYILKIATLTESGEYKIVKQ